MKRIAVSLFLASAAFVQAQTLVPLPTVNGQVNAFAGFGKTLYIAGDFDTVGGVTRNGVAAIDLNTNTVTAWNPNVTDGGNSANVYDIIVTPDGSTVYFGGMFDKVGAATRMSLAAVGSDGSLKAFAPTINGPVFAVRELNGAIYAIGEFKVVDGMDRVGFVGFDNAGAVNNFDARLNAFTSANYRAAALSPDGTKMYVSLGNTDPKFTDVDNIEVNRRGFVSLRLSDGLETKFRPDLKAGGNESGTFHLSVGNGILYIGGEFNQVEGASIDRVASYPGEVFDPVFSPEAGTGPGGSLRVVVRDNNVVYVAGAFDTIGGVTRKGIGALDATTGTLISDWDPKCDNQLSGNGNVLYIFDGKVFVGGPAIANGLSLVGQNVQYLAALSAIPAPVVDTPVTPVAAPTVKINGKPKVVTAKSKLTIKGTATDATAISYKVGSKGGTASGTAAWSFSAKLKLGKNVISVTAKGPGGVSSTAKITVTRK